MARNREKPMGNNQQRSKALITTALGVSWEIVLFLLTLKIMASLPNTLMEVLLEIQSLKTQFNHVRF